MGADEPSHLIRLSDDWSLWRTVCLRGAGFPVGLLDRLAFPDAAHAAAQLFDAEKARDAARDAAIAECRRRADALERAAARPFHRAIRKLKKNGTVKHFDGEDALNALLDDYDKAAKHAADTRADAEAVAEEAILEAGEAVRKFAEDPKFLEALVWQNRHVIDTAVEPLLRAPPRQNNRGIREKQRTLVSYLQRYCAKNDSIGFFGPFGWARWESTGPAVSAVPGPDLIAWRDVRLEHWGIAALSDLFVRDPAIRRHLYPRIHPNVRFDHGAILTPKRRFTPAKEIFKLLGACDGRTPAVEIAERVAADPDVPLETPAKVFQALAGLARRRVLIWDARIAVSPNADRDLAALIDSVKDEAVRQKMRGPLRALTEARENVARSRGDWRKLNGAIKDLEDTFSTVTKLPSTRRDGGLYAGRTLIYEDCRRDADVAFGPDVLRALSGPLDLVLRSAAWAASSYDLAFERYLSDKFDKVIGGRERMSLIEFAQIRPDYFQVGGNIANKTWAAVGRKWAEILKLDPAKSRQAFGAEEIRDAVYDHFPGGEIVAPVARNHSPDLMIAAADPDAIRRGEFLLVLGELHARMNTLMLSVTRSTHEHPESFDEFAEFDFQRSLILDTPGMDRAGGRVSAGMSYADVWQVNWSNLPARVGLERELPLGALSLCKAANGDLLIEHQERGLRFHIREFLKVMMPQATAANFSMLPAMAHRPRVTVDKVVISREQWRVPCTEIEFAAAKSGAARFVGAQQWRRDMAMPRYVFFRVPFEQKPYFLDFSSPVSVEVFAKMVRLGVELGEEKERRVIVTVSEMLPAPDQCWLTDAEGNRYSSEFRVAAVSKELWRVPDSVKT